MKNGFAHVKLGRAVRSVKLGLREADFSLDKLEPRQLLSLTATGTFTPVEAPQNIGFTFSSPLATDLVPTGVRPVDLNLANLTDGSAIPDGVTVESTYDATSRTVRFKFKRGSEYTYLPQSGRYEAIIESQQLSSSRYSIESSSGVRLADDEARLVFSLLYGDANLDGVSNFDDLLKVAANYNSTGKAWADGDSTYDTKVDFSDLLALAANYNRTLPTPPSAPSSLVSSRSGSAVDLTWTPPATLTGIEQFKVLRSTDNVNFVEVGAVSLNPSNPSTYSYSDATIGEGRRYWYRVRAVDGLGGVSIATNKVREVVPVAAVTSLRSTVISGSSIRLDWRNMSGTADAIRVVYLAAGESTQTVDLSGSATSATITGLTPGAEYAFTVISRVSSDSDRDSATVLNASTAAVTIDGPGQVRRGDTVQLTAVSSLPLTSYPISSYSWQASLNGEVLATGSGQSWRPDLTRPGRYAITLEAAMQIGGSTHELRAATTLNVATPGIEDVKVSGPSRLRLGEAGVFTANVLQTVASRVSYEWSVSEIRSDGTRVAVQRPVEHSPLALSTFRLIAPLSQPSGVVGYEVEVIAGDGHSSLRASREVELVNVPRSGLFRIDSPNESLPALRPSMIGYAPSGTIADSYRSDEEFYAADLSLRNGTTTLIGGGFIKEAYKAYPYTSNGLGDGRDYRVGPNDSSEWLVRAFNVDAGSTISGPSGQSVGAASRYRPAGQAGGYVPFTASPGTWTAFSHQIHDVRTDAMGRIYVAGVRQWSYQNQAHNWQQIGLPELVIARFTPNLSLDTSFNGTGVASFASPYDDVDSNENGSMSGTHYATMWGARLHIGSDGRVLYAVTHQYRDGGKFTRRAEIGRLSETITASGTSSIVSRSLWLSVPRETPMHSNGIADGLSSSRSGDGDADDVASLSNWDHFGFVIRAIATDEAGSVYATGMIDGNVAVIKLNEDLSGDASFVATSTGKVSPTAPGRLYDPIVSSEPGVLLFNVDDGLGYGWNSSSAMGNSIAIRDDRIIIGGQLMHVQAATQGETSPAVFRFARTTNGDWSPDSSFGNGIGPEAGMFGVYRPVDAELKTGWSNSQFVELSSQSLIVEGDGAIVLPVTVRDPSGVIGKRAGLLRLTSSGSPDVSFHDGDPASSASAPLDGVVVFSRPEDTLGTGAADDKREYAYGVISHPDGGYLVFGTSEKAKNRGSSRDPYDSADVADPADEGTNWMVHRYTEVKLGAADLRATLQADGGVALEWSDLSKGEDGFRIERRLVGSAETPATIGFSRADDPIFVDRAVEPGKTYEYKVIAFRGEDKTNDPPASLRPTVTVTTVPENGTWVLQEAIEWTQSQLQSQSGSIRQTIGTLDDGAVYKVRATGYFQLNPLGLYSDAAWGRWNPQPTSHSFMPGKRVRFGVSLGQTLPSDPIAMQTRYPRWGEADASHSYTVYHRGNGSPLTLQYWDSQYSDNLYFAGGSPLRVEIYRLAAATPARLRAHVDNAVTTQSVVELSWDHQGDNRTSYEVERRVGDGEFARFALLDSVSGTVQGANDTIVFSDPGMARLRDAVIAYRVRALRDEGETSEWSNVIEVRLNNQVPTWPAARTVAGGGLAVEVYATAFQTLQYRLQAVDPDGDSNRIVYRLVSGPAGAFLAEGGVLTGWAPTTSMSEATFVVEATDSAGGTSTMTIKATAANQAANSQLRFSIFPGYGFTLGEPEPLFGIKLRAEALPQVIGAGLPQSVEYEWRLVSMTPAAGATTATSVEFVAEGRAIGVSSSADASSWVRTTSSRLTARVTQPGSYRFEARARLAGAASPQYISAQTTFISPVRIESDVRLLSGESGTWSPVTTSSPITLTRGVLRRYRVDILDQFGIAMRPVEYPGTVSPNTYVRLIPTSEGGGSGVFDIGTLAPANTQVTADVSYGQLDDGSGFKRTSFIFLAGANSTVSGSPSDVASVDGRFDMEDLGRWLNVSSVIKDAAGNPIGQSLSGSRNLYLVRYLIEYSPTGSAGSYTPYSGVGEGGLSEWTSSRQAGLAPSAAGYFRAQAHVSTNGVDFNARGASFSIAVPSVHTDRTEIIPLQDVTGGVNKGQAGLQFKIGWRDQFGSLLSTPRRTGTSAYSVTWGSRFNGNYQLPAGEFWNGSSWVNSLTVPEDQTVTFRARNDDGYALIRVIYAGSPRSLGTAEFAVGQPPNRAPSVAITSPAYSAAGRPAILKHDSDVEVVVDDPESQISQWKLDLIARDDSTMQLTLGSGTGLVGSSPDNGSPVAQVPASNLPNGYYILRLWAKDGANQEVTVEKTVEVRSDVKLGNFTLPQVDLTLELPGRDPVVVRRVYDSVDVYKNQRAGWGWRFEIDESRFESSEGQSQRGGGGATPTALRGGDALTFYLPGRGKRQFVFGPKVPYGASPYGELDVQFLSVDGSHAKLVADVGTKVILDNFSKEYLVRVKPSGTNGLDLGDSYTLRRPNSFVEVVEQDGTRYRIEALSGRVTRITSPYGQVTEFGTPTVAGNQRTTAMALGDGRTLTLYESRGSGAGASEFRVDRITLSGVSGNALEYSYDTTGRLTGVKRILEGTRTQYEYGTGSSLPDSRLLTAVREVPLDAAAGATGIRQVSVKYDPFKRTVKELTDASDKKVFTEEASWDGTTRVERSRDSSGAILEVRTVDQSHEIGRSRQITRRIQMIQQVTSNGATQFLTSLRVEYYGVDPSLNDTVAYSDTNQDKLFAVEYHKSIALGSLALARAYDGWNQSTMVRSQIFKPFEPTDLTDLHQLVSDTAYGADGSARTTYYAGYVDGKPTRIISPDGVETTVKLTDTRGTDGFLDVRNVDTVRTGKQGIRETIEDGRIVASFNFVDTNGDGRFSTGEPTSNASTAVFDTQTGLPTESVDSSGTLTRNVYDSQRRLTHSATLVEPSTSGESRFWVVNKLMYDGASSRVVESLEERVVTTSTAAKPAFDTSATPASSRRISKVQYDSFGRAQFSWGADTTGSDVSTATTGWYDRRGNLLRTFNPDGTESLSILDAAGNAIWTTERMVTPSGTNSIAGASGTVNVTAPFASFTLYDDGGRALETRRHANVTFKITKESEAGVTFYKIEQIGTLSAPLSRSTSEYDGARLAKSTSTTGAWTSYSYRTDGTVQGTTTSAGQRTSAGRRYAFEFSVDATGTYEVTVTKNEPGGTTRSETFNVAVTNLAATLASFSTAGFATQASPFDAAAPTGGDSLAKHLHATVVDGRVRLLSVTDDQAYTVKVKREASNLDVASLRANRSGQLVRVESGGEVWRNTVSELDAEGRVVRTTFQDGSFTQTVYAPVGQLAQLPGVTLPTDASSSTNRSGTSDPTYAGVGVLSAMSRTSNPLSSVEGVPAQRTHVIDIAQRKPGEDPVATHRVYSADGQLLHVWLPAVDDKSTTSTEQLHPHYTYAYDARGNQVAEVDPYGYKTTFEYDQLDRRTKRILPTGEKELFVYDTRDRVQWQRDFNGVWTFNEYDDSVVGAGRLYREYRVAAPATPVDTPPSQSPAVSGSYRWLTEYMYDDNSSLASEERTYLGRRVGVKRFERSSGSNTLVFESRTKFDAVTGQPSQIEEDMTPLVSTDDVTMNYEYSPSTGEQTRAYLKTAAGVIREDTAYRYNSIGQLNTVTAVKRLGLPVSEETRYSYDLSGQLVEQFTTGTNIQHAFKYDALGRRTEVLAQEVTSPTAALNIFKQELTLRTDGQATSVKDWRYNASGTLTGRNEVEFEYDALNRLFRERFARLNASGATIAGSSHHDYFYLDLAGNRVGYTRDVGIDGSINDSVASSFAGDRLISETRPLSTTSRTTTFSYDRNGSQTVKLVQNDSGTQTARSVNQWNEFGDMVAVDGNGDNDLLDDADVLLRYDDAGLRRERRFGSWSGSIASDYYHLDALNPTGHVQVVEQHEKSGADPQNIFATTGFTIGQDVIAQTRSDQVMAYHLDPEYGYTASTYNSTLVYDVGGSVRGITNTEASTGTTVIQTYNYDAFGNPVSFAGTTMLVTDQNVNLATIPDYILTPLGYRGENHDRTLGLQWLRDRYYVPSLGRFNSFDSYAGDPNDPQTLHKFGYGHQNPIYYADPTGQSADFSLGGQLFIAGTMSWMAGGFLLGSNQGVDAAQSLEWLLLMNGTPAANPVRVQQWIDPVTAGLMNGLQAVNDFMSPEGGPGFWEGMIPVWGNGKTAGAHFANGNMGAGLFFTIMAVADIVSLGAASAGIKAGVKGALGAGGKALNKSVKFAFGEAGEAALRKAHIIARSIIGTLCFVGGTPVLLGDGQTLVNIEDVQVGWRVATDGGESEHGFVSDNPNATEINLADYRLLTLRVDGKLNNGSDDPWQIQTLVPVSKLVAADVDVGDFVNAGEFSFLSFDELGVEGDVLGQVEAIEPSPTIQSGTGRVVLSTIMHLGDAIFRLTLKGEDGKTETLGVTGPHRFYSEARGWVQTQELLEGETVRGKEGPMVVIGLTRQTRIEPVFNLSVEADHVYYVGSSETLTHNSYWRDIKKAINTKIVHATERAVERLGLEATVARERLEELTKWITRNKTFPDGTLPDPKRADSVLVPFENGFAVYEIAKNGTAKLMTVILEAAS
jgi:RHS repeat-associated protein